MSRVFSYFSILVCLNLPMAMSYGQTGVRLFLTPEVRLELERRRLGISEAPASTPSIVEVITDFVTQDSEPEPDLIYALGGSMLKSDGSSTVWLNGLAVEEASLPVGVRIEKPASMGKLIVSTNNQDYVIKPGQVLNATTGVIYESYQWQQQLEMQRIEKLMAEGSEQVEDLVDSISEETP